MPTAADRRRVRRLRLTAQLLVPTVRRTPLEVMCHLGALQAQDHGNGLWSVGLRSGVSADEVAQAVADRQIVRTWPMRGTLHYVPAQDARWMCRLLSGPAIRSTGRVWERLGLTDEVLGRARDVLTAAVGDGPRSRPDLFAALRAAGIDPDGQRGYHLLGRLCQEGLLCQATPQGRQPAFALIDEWVPRSLDPGREEGLATVVERYVRSHGPVTETDLAGWLAAPLGVVREGLTLLGDRVLRETAGGTAYLVHRDAAPPAPSASAHLLPMWDEYLLGYKDRSAALAPEDAARVVPGANGVFRASVLVDGQVAGVWKRRTGRDGVAVSVQAFGPLTDAALRRVGRAVSGYGSFLGEPAVLAAVGIG